MGYKMDICQVAALRIRKMRLEKNMTIDDLAEKCDVSTQTIKLIEAGRRNFKIKTLYTIANSLNVSSDYLIGRIDTPVPESTVVGNLISELTTEEVIYLVSILSRYVEILKKAGVDMTTSKPLESTINRFNELNEELLKKEYKEKAEEIFKSIPMKMEKFYERFDAECMNIPIFKYYDPYQAFQRISCASNEDIVAIKEKIIDRANNNPEITKIEALNLKMLGQIINDYIKGKETTIKTVLLREFAKELNEILKK